MKQPENNIISLIPFLSQITRYQIPEAISNFWPVLLPRLIIKLKTLPYSFPSSVLPDRLCTWFFHENFPVTGIRDAFCPCWWTSASVNDGRLKNIERRGEKEKRIEKERRRGNGTRSKSNGRQDWLLSGTYGGSGTKQRQNRSKHHPRSGRVSIWAPSATLECLTNSIKRRSRPSVPSTRDSLISVRLFL